MAETETPDWARRTPGECSYDLAMHEGGGESVENIDLTRVEYTALKRHLAKLRGFRLESPVEAGEQGAPAEAEPRAEPKSKLPSQAFEETRARGQFAMRKMYGEYVESDIEEFASEASLADLMLLHEVFQTWQNFHQHESDEAVLPGAMAELFETEPSGDTAEQSEATHA